ncbi:MAG: hypothetical protein IPH62_15205 [Ignavibacteriae bacterium]|nr:hypothetical protein [Ignavibacteriota bacterium]
MFTSINVQSQNINQDSTLTNSEADTTFIMTKSPTGAMLRSAIIPGWGQFYNESYWKIPIIWGAAAWFVYGWQGENDNYNYFSDLYNKSLLDPSNNLTLVYKNIRDGYRDNRDLFAIYLGLTYFLNVIDAYVDAHLFDFDIGMNSFTKEPEFKIKFNF